MVRPRRAGSGVMSGFSPPGEHAGSGSRPPPCRRQLPRAPLIPDPVAPLGEAFAGAMLVCELADVDEQAGLASTIASVVTNSGGTNQPLMLFGPRRACQSSPPCAQFAASDIRSHPLRSTWAALPPARLPKAVVDLQGAADPAGQRVE